MLGLRRRPGALEGLVHSVVVILPDFLNSTTLPLLSMIATCGRRLALEHAGHFLAVLGRGIDVAEAVVLEQLAIDDFRVAFAQQCRLDAGFRGLRFVEDHQQGLVIFGAGFRQRRRRSRTAIQSTPA